MNYTARGVDRISGTRRALVVGLGISGTATAARLRGIGWTTVVIERSATRRTDGYFIGLFGAGRAAARELGILEDLADRAPAQGSTFDLDRAGKLRRGLGFRDLPGRPWMMLRGDVERAAHAALPDAVEVRYSTVPTGIEQDDRGVLVTMVDTAGGRTVTERFDLVVGADGLHSTVRSLAFGPDERYLHRLDYVVAAFPLDDPLSELAPGDGATLVEPGRSMWIFPFADRPSTVLLSYRTDDVDAQLAEPPARRMRAVFGPEPLGRTLEEVLAAMEVSDDVLFDSVEQVRMDRWHRGRVVLVGDAAWCVSLYSGMGVSAGLSGAQLLGDVLTRRPADIPRALAEWDRMLRPHIAFYQRNGIDQISLFTPSSRRQIVTRRVLGRLHSNPVLGSIMRQGLAYTKASRMKDRDLTRA